MQTKHFILFSILLLGSVSCSSSVVLDSANADDADGTTTASSELFPADLSVSSPTNASTINASLSASSSVGFAASSADLALSDTAATVESLLAATDIADCAFDIEIPNATTAPIPECYGPTADYENHPDIGDENSGELPSGDLGLWTADDATTGLACSAAELNYRLDLVEARAEMAQLSLASMVCVLNNSKTVSMPTSGSTADLTTELAAVLDSSTVSISSATLALETTSGLNTYTYALSLNVTDATTAEVQALTINMTHDLADEKGTSFSGVMNYQFNDTVAGGNCIGDVTEAGSVKYSKDDTGNYGIRADSAEFCMSDDSPFTADGVLDPTYQYDGVTAGGWGNNYNIFLAKYDPATLEGNYSNSWQAGSQDSNTRVFNLAIASVEKEKTGEAYFGYGLDVGDENFDGSIAGFICDWAVEGSSHTLTESVQHQSLVLDGEEFTASASDILYAPTSSCDYIPADDTDGFVFSYDLDGDGTISEDETLSIATDGIANGLLDITEMDFEVPATL